MLLSRGPNSLGTPGESGGGPDWLPAGAVAGVDYTRGEAYLNNTLITDLSTIHGGGFDPSAVTGDGMAVLDANANRPTATGALLAKLIAGDYCVKIVFETIGYSPNETGFSAILEVADNEDFDVSSNGFQIGFEADDNDNPIGTLYSSDFSGNYDTVGIVRPNSNQIVVASSNDDGVLSSLSGATAVLDAVPLNLGTPVAAWIGCGGAGIPLNGSIQRIIFYPNGKTAEEVEVLATPDWVEALRAPSNDLPLLAWDWSASPSALFWRQDMGLCSVTDIWRELLLWEAWDPETAIVPGSGMGCVLTGSGGAGGGFPTMTPEAFAVGNMAAGFTCLTRGIYGDADSDGDMIGGSAWKSPDYVTEADWSIPLRATGAVFASPMDLITANTSVEVQFDGGRPTPPVIHEPFGNVVTLTVADGWSFSTNGEAITTLAWGETPDPLWDTFSFGSSQITNGPLTNFATIGAIYAPQPNADLPTLSAL